MHPFIITNYTNIMYLIISTLPCPGPAVVGASHVWRSGLGGVGRLECRVRAAPPPLFTWHSQTLGRINNTHRTTVHMPQVGGGRGLGL